jgi:lysozyme family protein
MGAALTYSLQGDVAPAGPAALRRPNLPAPAPASRFEACIPVILAAEGGFVNDPRDPGGATNHGITLRTLADWRHRDVSVAEVRALSVAESAAIYRARYWAPLQCDALPAGVDLMVFDFGVNAGIGRSARLLQAAVGAVPDGKLGPATLAKVAAVPPRELVARLAEARLDYYRRLPTYGAFGRGWTARVADVKRRALAMAG